MNPIARKLAAAFPVAAALLMASAPALAHHPMGGAVPATAWHGLLSGLAHPVIGLDHLVFLLGAGLLAAWTGLRGASLAFAFAAAGMAATLARASGVMSVAALDYTVPATLLALAAWSAVHSGPRHMGWVALAAAAGVAHGYAFGEAVIGAEATPLAAYLIGLALIQSALLVAAFVTGRRIARSAPQSVRNGRRLLGLLSGASAAWAAAALLMA